MNRTNPMLASSSHDLIEVQFCSVGTLGVGTAIWAPAGPKGLACQGSRATVRRNCHRKGRQTTWTTIIGFVNLPWHPQHSYQGETRSHQSTLSRSERSDLR